MNELQERAETYAAEKMNELMAKAIAQAYIDGYQNGYNDRAGEILKQDCIEANIDVNDLGLPSGTMWAPNYLNNEKDRTDYFPYIKAAKLGLPTKEQVDELIAKCRWQGSYSSSGLTLYNAVCIGASGERILFETDGYMKDEKRVDASSGRAYAYFWIKDDEDGDEKNAVKIYDVISAPLTILILTKFPTFRLSADTSR